MTDRYHDYCQHCAPPTEDYNTRQALDRLSWKPLSQYPGLRLAPWVPTDLLLCNSCGTFWRYRYNGREEQLASCEPIPAAFKVVMRVDGPLEQVWPLLYPVTDTRRTLLEGYFNGATYDRNRAVHILVEHMAAPDLNAYRAEALLGYLHSLLRGCVPLCRTAHEEAEPVASLAHPTPLIALLQRDDLFPDAPHRRADLVDDIVSLACGQPDTDYGGLIELPARARQRLQQLRRHNTYQPSVAPTPTPSATAVTRERVAPSPPPGSSPGRPGQRPPHQPEVSRLAACPETVAVRAALTAWIKHVAWSGLLAVFYCVPAFFLSLFWWAIAPQSLATFMGLAGCHGFYVAGAVHALDLHKIRFLGRIFSYGPGDFIRAAFPFILVMLFVTVVVPLIWLFMGIFLVETLGVQVDRDASATVAVVVWLALLSTIVVWLASRVWPVYYLCLSDKHILEGDHSDPFGLAWRATRQRGTFWPFTFPAMTALVLLFVSLGFASAHTFAWQGTAFLVYATFFAPFLSVVIVDRAAMICRLAPPESA